MTAGRAARRHPHARVRPHLVGDAFTAADLNVASVLSLASLAGIDLRPFPDEEGWLGRCRARPAFRRVAR